MNEGNPFEPTETATQRHKRSDQMIRENVDATMDEERVAFNIFCRAHQVYFCQFTEFHLAGHGCPKCWCEVCGGTCILACPSHKELTNDYRY
jgi:hypothetical protein